MQVIDPFIAYAADSVDQATRRRYLAELSARLAALPRSEPVRE
jgi:putative NADPH-quinone reductase